MDADAARRFADEWQREWNAHDLDALLSHYSDDVVFSSPVASQLMPETGGVLRGKASLRAYFTEGLRRIPDLRFEVVACYVGVDALVLNYRNQASDLVNEVLIFDGDVVISGHGTYLRSDGVAGVDFRGPSRATGVLGCTTWLVPAAPSLTHEVS